MATSNPFPLYDDTLNEKERRWIFNLLCSDNVIEIEEILKDGIRSERGKSKSAILVNERTNIGGSIKENMLHLCQPIRLLLEYVGDVYEEKLYDQGDVEIWMKEKFNLDLDLPNLPYYIDGEVKLTQSIAILRYIADKHKMLGNSPKEKARVSMIEGALMDMRMRLVELAYHENYPTHLDFMLYEALTSIGYLEPECMNKFPNLEQFCHRIEALPNIKAYMESKKFIQWPLHFWTAHFGGGDAPPS